MKHAAILLLFSLIQTAIITCYFEHRLQLLDERIDRAKSAIAINDRTARLMFHQGQSLILYHDLVFDGGAAI